MCSLDVAELLDRGRRFRLDRAVDEVAAVDLEGVRRLAEQVLTRSPMASAVCGPRSVAEEVA
jgi:hypothetical protein